MTYLTADERKRLRIANQQIAGTNVVNFNEALKQRDSARRERDMNHIMRCTIQGCLRCQPLDFELRRVARTAKSVA